MTTLIRGDARSIGGEDRGSSVDIAPGIRDGQPVVLLWAGDGEGEPAVLPIRAAVLLAAALPRCWQEAIGLAADQLGS